MSGRAASEGPDTGRRPDAVASVDLRTRPDRWTGVAVGGGYTFDGLAEIARLAEELGLDGVWLEERADRERQRTAGQLARWADGPQLQGAGEVFTVLGGLAVRTRSLRLAPLPRQIELRASSMVAKLIAGLDVISEGRAVACVALGPSGDLVGDVAPVGGAVDQVQHAVERLTVLRAVLEDEHPTVEGRYESVHDAVNRPAPVAPGGVPVVGLWIGSSSPTIDDLEPYVDLLDALVVDASVAPLDALCAAFAHRFRPGRADASGPGIGRRPRGVIGLIPTGAPSDRAAGADGIRRGIEGVFDAGGSGVIVDLTGAASDLGERMTIVRSVVEFG